MNTFTPIKPSADSRLIYVSSSEGSDTNPGTKEKPVKSIKTGVAKMRKGFPDHVYLKRGDVWRETRVIDSVEGRSLSEPTVMAFYGTGPRPKIEANDRPISIINERYRLKNLNIIGIHFYAYKMDPKHPEFDATSHATVKLVCNNENVKFEDNVFDLIEVTLEGWNGFNPKDIILRRNIWTGSYVNTSSYSQTSRPSNLFASRVNGLLIEENVFDYGGWHPTVKGAGANMYNHNIYLQTTNVGSRIVLRGNILTRGSSHGVQLRAGGLAEDNFFARNAIAMNFGYFKEPITSGAIAHAFNNVVTEGHSMVRGVDACQGPNLCTPAVWGIMAPAYDIGNADYQSKGNLVHSHSEYDTQTLYTRLVFKTEGEVVNGWVQGKHNQGRTLADYNAALGGKRDFDEFMNKALTRPLQEWPVELSAKAINTFVREGTVVPEVDIPSTPPVDVPDVVQPEPAPLATITDITLAKVDTGSLEPIEKLEDGVSIPEGLFNFIVDTTIGRIGSMGFNLDGPVKLERYENNAIYTVAEETQGINLVPGNYTLKSIVYSDPDMSGEAGETSTFTFSVVAPAVEEPTPEEPTEEIPPTIPADEYITVEVTGTFKFKVIK